jgi:hypothetical protein
MRVPVVVRVSIDIGGHETGLLNGADLAEFLPSRTKSAGKFTLQRVQPY